MSNKVKIISIITYLIYIIVWDCGLIGGCTYLVFWKGISGYWFFLAVILSFCGFKPKHWRSLSQRVSYEDKEDE